MTRRAKITTGVVAAAGLILVTVAALYGNKDRDVSRVTVERALQTDLVSKVTANGKIQAKKKVDLSATMSGQIVNLAVREGDRVKRGEFLLQIDRTTLQAQADSTKAALEALFADRDQARANMERSRLEFERARSSYKDGVVSEMEFTRNRTEYDAQKAGYEAIERRIEQARASFVGARDTLQKTTITAPMDGAVTRLQVEEGEVAMIGTMNNPGTALMTISDLSVIEAEIEVDETEIPEVKLGQDATLVIDAYPGVKFNGVVTDIASSPIVIPTATGPANTGVDFEVKVRVNDPPPNLRPGLSCTAEITTGKKPQVVAVPIQALVLREGKEGAGDEEEGVFVMEGGKAHFRTVKTGITGDLDIEITVGVAAGDEIITGPFKILRTLKDDDRVMVEAAAREAGK